MKTKIKFLFCLWTVGLCGNFTLAFSASPDANRMVIQMSDDSVFRGFFEDKDNTLLTIKTDGSEEINLPISEIRTINGAAPQTFFKKFIPIIPDSLFSPMEISVNKGKTLMTFKILSSWSQQKLANGYVFLGPDENRHWEGFRFNIKLESPPALQGDAAYSSVIKKLVEAGTQILSESYDTALGTRTLRTTEVAKGNLAGRALRQFRMVNGEKCLLELALYHQTKERLNEPRAIALFDKVLATIQFPTPPAPKPVKP